MAGLIWAVFPSPAECSPGFLLFQQGCVRNCPPGFTRGSLALNYSLENWVEVSSVRACLPCHATCLTCAAAGPSDCLSCPPHNHLDPFTGTCLHQNQILRESPDGPAGAGEGGAGPGAEPSSRLPVAMAVVGCFVVVVTFAAVFAMLQLRSGHGKLHTLEAGAGARGGFGIGRGRVVSYKGIPSVWGDDGFNSESENEEFDIHSERTAFIKTQSAL